MKRILVVLLVFVLSGCNWKSDPEIYISATELVQAYEDDELQASIDYDDKRVQITAVISSIGGTKDSPEINFHENLTCTFDSQASTIASLSENTLITVNGTVSVSEGIMGLIVDLVDCEYISTDLKVDSSIDISELDDNLTLENLHKIFEITGEIANSYLSGVISFRTGTYSIESFDVSDDLDLDNFNSGDEVKIRGVVVYQAYAFTSMGSYEFVVFDVELIE